MMQAMAQRDAAILAASDKDKARFWLRVRKSADCWLFETAGIKGYGYFRAQGVQVLAHRFAKIVTDGMPEHGKLACHRCDTPLCVRPDHIYWGDYSDNLNDRNAAYDAYSSVRGEGHHMARLAEADVRRIWHDYFFEGMSITALARRHSVNIPVVFKLVGGRSWVHITRDLPRQEREKGKHGRHQ